MVLHQDHSTSRMGNRRRSVGVFPTRQAAEQALQDLRNSGFPMDHVSIITRDTDRPGEIAGSSVHDTTPSQRIEDKTGNKADEGGAIGAVTGGALGGITGLLVGLGTLAIPGIGPVMLAGATATAIATTLAGGAIGAVTGGLLGGLIGLGIPEERARVYHDRIARGEYLVIVDGNEAEISQAERILHHHKIEEYGVYDSPTTAHTDVGASPVRGHRRQAVGIFSRQQDAEAALTDLRQAGFPLHQISLITRTFDRRESFAGVDFQERFDAMRYGVPSDRAELYNRRFGQGDYLLVVQGSESVIDRAANILQRRGIQEWQVYDSSIADSTRGNQISRGFKRAIGLFSHRHDTEAALSEIRGSGFRMDRVSVIAKDRGSSEQIAGTPVDAKIDRRTSNKADEGAKAGAATGAAVGGLGGLLVGLGTLAIPGIGPVILGGAAATALATALGGGAIGAAAGGLVGGLVGLGIPEDRAKVYRDRLNQGDDLVIIEGSEAEMRQVEPILKRHNIREWEIYDADDVKSSDNANTVDSIYQNRVSDERTGLAASKDHPTDPDVIIVDRRHENTGNR